jgi:hypothetical protein
MECKGVRRLISPRCLPWDYSASISLDDENVVLLEVRRSLRSVKNRRGSYSSGVITRYMIISSRYVMPANVQKPSLGWGKKMSPLGRKVS